MYHSTSASTRYYQNHLCEQSILIDNTGKGGGIRSFYEYKSMSTKYKVTEYAVMDSWLNTEPNENGYYIGQCKLSYTVVDSTDTSSARKLECESVLSYKLGYNTASESYMLYELEDRGSHGKMDIQNADDILSNVLSQDSVLIGEYTSEYEYEEDTKCTILYTNDALQIEGELECLNEGSYYRYYWLQNGLPDIVEPVADKDNIGRYSFNLKEGKVCKEPYFSSQHEINTIYSYEKSGIIYYLCIAYDVYEKHLSISIRDDIDNKTGHGISLFY